MSKQILARSEHKCSFVAILKTDKRNGKIKRGLKKEENVGRREKILRKREKEKRQKVKKKKRKKMRHRKKKG